MPDRTIIEDISPLPKWAQKLIELLQDGANDE